MKKGTLLIILIVVILFLANLSLFIVDETKQAIVLQFGKPIRD
jgi:regulator of protease activity HflC (stomatin/prohibitin superfamily)